MRHDVYSLSESIQVYKCVQMRTSTKYSGHVSFLDVRAAFLLPFVSRLFLRGCSESSILVGESGPSFRDEELSDLRLRVCLTSVFIEKTADLGAHICGWTRTLTPTRRAGGGWWARPIKAAYVT